MQCRAMHLAGCVDRPSTGAFAERFMSSASSVLPTADCVIYHVLTACLPLHDFSCLPCFAAFRRAARLQFRFTAPLIYFVSASLLPGLLIAACGSLPTTLSQAAILLPASRSPGFTGKPRTRRNPHRPDASCTPDHPLPALLQPPLPALRGCGLEAARRACAAARAEAACRATCSTARPFAATRAHRVQRAVRHRRLLDVRRRHRAQVVGRLQAAQPCQLVDLVELLARRAAPCRCSATAPGRSTSDDAKPPRPATSDRVRTRSRRSRAGRPGCGRCATSVPSKYFRSATITSSHRPRSFRSRTR